MKSEKGKKNGTPEPAASAQPKFVMEFTEDELYIATVALLCGGDHLCKSPAFALDWRARKYHALMARFSARKYHALMARFDRLCADAVLGNAARPAPSK